MGRFEEGREKVVSSFRQKCNKLKLSFYKSLKNKIKKFKNLFIDFTMQ